MTYIGIDTNIWIYLAKSTSLVEIWKKLVSMQQNSEIQIFINEAVMFEWKRNKQTTIESVTKEIKKEYDSAKRIADYLPTETKVAYLEIISKYSDEKNRIAQAEARVEEVEKFMIENCSSVPVTESQKLYIAELAIHNKPPFQNRKNNYNDALILRSLCEFIIKENYVLHDLIYVSNNPDDFIDKSTNKVHSSLLDGVENIRLKNVTDLGHALHIAPNLVEEINQWLEYELQSESMYQLDVIRGK